MEGRETFLFPPSSSHSWTWPTCVCHLLIICINFVCKTRHWIPVDIIQLKWDHMGLGWVLNPMTNVLIRRGIFGSKYGQWSKPYDERGKDRNFAIANQRILRNAKGFQQPSGTNSLPEPSRRNQFAKSLLEDFQHAKLWDNKLLLSWTSQWVVFYPSELIKRILCCIVCLGSYIPWACVNKKS